MSNLLMKKICVMPFGSYLYGTNTVNSDKDYKVVFKPSLFDCVNNLVKHNYNQSTKLLTNLKNTKNDVETCFYSLQYFVLTLGAKGDTAFLDMIHCPENLLLETSDEWEFLRNNRKDFYTSNMKSYAGYCKHQALIYGNKALKIQTAKNILNLIEKAHINNQDKIASIYEMLPEDTYCAKYELNESAANDKKVFDFCGKRFMCYNSIESMQKVLNNFILSYGDRVKETLKNDNIDWKALSHAFRVAYQLKELYETHDLKFPLQNAEFIKDIKLGRLNMEEDNLPDKLDELIHCVEHLATISTFPQIIDTEKYHIWINELYQ